LSALVLHQPEIGGFDEFADALLRAFRALVVCGGRSFG
jgi:hypothetical protein